jgi:hypothetical protein
MNPITRAAYLSELEKIAATMEQLYGAARRTKALRITKGQVRSAATAGPKKSGLAVGSVPVYHRYGPRTVPRAGPQMQPSGKQAREMHSQGVMGVAALPSPDAATRRGIAGALAQSVNYRNSRRGKKAVVRSVPGGGSASLGMRFSPDTPAEKKALGHRVTNTFARIHEGFEKKVKPHQVSPIGSHLSPKVLMDERNLVQKATGEGSEGMRRLRHQFRNDRTIEQPVMEGALRKFYGSRAVAHVNEHGYSKAMKKDLVRKFRDPARSADFQDIEKNVNRRRVTKARRVYRRSRYEDRKGEHQDRLRTARIRAALKKHRNSEK